MVFLRAFLTTLTLCCSYGALAQDSISKKKPIPVRIVDFVSGALREFNNVDTTYIEPQHYNFSAMAQATYFFERYRITSKSGQTITFAPETRIKVGPYAGWSLFFLGYTIDLAYISANKKKELEMSIYTSRIGVDLFYRRSGHQYNIKDIDFDSDDIEPLSEDIPFGGLDVSITGLNAYYILNHRKFSYPAAFSQSTCQRKSCGSVILGAGYTRHSLSMDVDKLVTTLQPYNVLPLLDEGLFFKSIHYTDISFSAGYAYNWVFSKNWLLNISLSAGLGYKHSTGDFIKDAFIFRDFSFSNFNFDGVGRFGLVWNNSKWYFGSNAVIHSYNYKKSQFATSNDFGNINIYIGFNFGRKNGH
jgi:hypothetical protein